MNKWIRNIVVGIGALVILFFAGGVIFQLFQPRPIHWGADFRRLSVEPYGTKIFHAQLRHFFPHSTVKPFLKTDFDPHGAYLESVDTLELEEALNATELAYFTDEDADFNLVGITNFLNATEYDTELLLLHVSSGNTVYIATTGLSNVVQREFEVETESISDEELLEKKNIEAVFSEELRSRPDSATVFNYFKVYPDDAEVLGRYSNGRVFKIAIERGDGKAIFNLHPYIFGNHFILNQNKEIAKAEMLSLPDEDTYYFTQLNISHYDTKSPSVLKFIHSKESLTWAFYTLLIGLTLFLVFQIRRVEKSTPLQTIKKNRNLKYVYLLSDLLYKNNDQKIVVRYKMDYLLHNFKRKHRINTNKIDNELAVQLAGYSSIPESRIKKLFVLYHALLAQSEPNKNMFAEYNQIIQLFK